MNEESVGRRVSATLTSLVQRERVVVPLVFGLLIVLDLLVAPEPLMIATLAVLALAALVSSGQRGTPPYAHGLPGIADGPPAPSRFSPYAHVAISAVAALAAAVLIALAAGWWGALVVAALGAAAWLVVADDHLRHRRHSRALRRALEAYAPTIAMAFAGRSGAPWQLRMWEPYLVRSGEPCIVINHHEKYVQMILDGAELTSPFIQLGSGGSADLPEVLVPSLTSLYYVQNAQRNADYMAHDHLTHVWLNHGDSDKPANFNPRHALYDVLVVCGQAGIDRYARHGIDIAREKFAVLGRPQATGVRLARGPVAERDPQTVLYAPTWHGLDAAVNFSSLERGPEIVRALLDRGATVIFRPHPLSYRWRIRRAVVREIRALLRDDRARTGRKHVVGKKAEKTWSVVDCANRADALISDVSSVVSDFLQSEKPYAMTSMHGSAEEFRAEFSVAETGYVLLGDLSNLEEVLDDLLGADPLAEARRERKRYVLGDFDGEESADAFAEFVRDLARRGAATR